MTDQGATVLLKQADAVDAARAILDGARVSESPRLELIAAALKPNAPAVTVPNQATRVMKDLAIKARTNYLPLVLDTLAQALKVEGYRSMGASENARPWQNWQRNAMDARQTGIHRSALSYGAAYATALPGDVGPVIEGHSPRRMTAVYQNPSRDEWPMLALQVDGPVMRLYDEEAVYWIGDESYRTTGRSGFAGMDYSWAQLDFIEARPHGLGVCPVVRFRDRMLLEGDEQYGVIEPLLAIQSRIDETVFGLLVAQFFAAFRQRYVIGWMPEDEQEKLKATASQLWTFADPDVKVGDLAETDLTRYLQSKASAVRDLAAISQVPATSLTMDGISNISAEALAGLESAKDRKVDEVATSLGESHEQLLRLCARIEGDAEAEQDFSAQVRWKSTSTRSLAQVTDALTKWVSTLDIPPEFAWTMLPDITDTDIQEILRLRAKAQAEVEAQTQPEPEEVQETERSGAAGSAAGS